jgi:hypothetical protein
MGYGALGALFTLLVVQVLPWGVSLARGHAQIQVTRPRVVGVGLVFAGFIVGGAVVAYLFSNDLTGTRDAIEHGIAWQGIAGGIPQAVAASNRAAAPG